MGRLCFIVLFFLIHNLVYSQVINEWDWDELGTDSGEFIEVFIPDPQPADLTQYSIVEYETSGASAGNTQGVHTLDNFVATPDAVAMGTFYVLVESFENNDAVALCGPAGVIQFLYTENSVTASNGCAMGMAATSIGCNGSYPSGGSMQLLAGGGYIAFDSETPGMINNECLITSIATGIISDCTNVGNDTDDSNDTFTAEIIISYSNAPYCPDSDTEITIDIAGNQITEEVTSSPQTITLTLPADGTLNLDVTANFTLLTSCTFTQANLFDAPEACSSCNMVPNASSVSGGATFSTQQATDINGVDVNTLDDTYIASQELIANMGNCQVGSYTQTYGTVNANGDGTGTISGLVDLDGAAISDVPFAMYQIDQVCASSGVQGTAILNGGQTGASLQDDAPTPTGLNSSNIFTEVPGVGGSTMRNQVCFDLNGTSITNISFWIGDVETSDNTPGYIITYDQMGNLIANQEIPTSVPVASQSGPNCTGNSGGIDSGSGCGNDETVFVSVSAASPLGTVCVQVGDLSDDNVNPGGTEHLSFGGFAVGGTCLTVPVEFTSFQAEKTGDFVLLNWSTSTEINNDYFIVQHSLDGENFDDLDYIQGNGTTSTEQYYRYEHGTPAQTINYYRLKQVDYDGTTDFSNIVSVRFGTESDFEIEIYPTVFNDIVNITSTTQLIDTDAMVYNVQGALVLRKTINNYEVDLSTLSTGTFVLRIVGNNIISTHRIIKL